MRSNINVEIALTHIFTRKRQTLVAALGVTMGIAMYIFSNSLMKGFGKYSRTEIFKVTPHLRIYKDDEISQPLIKANLNELLGSITWCKSPTALVADYLDSAF